MNARFSIFAISIFLILASLQASAQIKQNAFKNVTGDWIVMQKTTSKHRGEHKVQLETTNYSKSATDKITYSFQLPNKLIITEIENKNGKEEVEIDHYEIKEFNDNDMEVEKLNDDDLIKDTIRASWKINKQGHLTLTFKKKKTFSNTTKVRTLILQRDANHSTH